jgi:hypothetical protein
MGLDTNGIKFLLSSHRNGVSLRRTLMVGRQILNLDFHEFKRNLKGFSLYKSDDQVENLLTVDGGYAEGFLKTLGAETIDSLDYSNYEGANLLHDMNLVIPDGLKRKYDLVLESGSLEHIFNFPVSMANCMASKSMSTPRLAPATAAKLLLTGSGSSSQRIHIPTASIQIGRL